MVETRIRSAQGCSEQSVYANCGRLLSIGTSCIDVDIDGGVRDLRREIGGARLRGARVDGWGRGGVLKVLKAATAVGFLARALTVLPKVDGGQCAFTQVRETPPCFQEVSESMNICRYLLHTWTMQYAI